MAVALIGGVVALVGGWQNRDFFYDDAFISLRYAHNFLQHGQLVWNLGEPVEGYTNFLHLLATAAVGSLGLDLVTAARIVNGASYVALVAGFLVSAIRLGRLLGAVMGTALLASSYPLVAWIWGGLEAPLFAALVFFGHMLVILALRGSSPTINAALAGLVFALACLTRPDGIVFAGLGAAALLVAAPQPPKSRLGLVIVFAGAVALPLLVHMGWRLSYYGDPLPNTFYTKVSGLPSLVGYGFAYLLRFALTPPCLPLLALIAMPPLWRGRWRTEARYLFASTIAYTGYVLSVGGDHMPLFRLFVAVVPLLAMLFALAVSAFEQDEGLRRALLPSLLLSMGLMLLQPIVIGRQPMSMATFVGTIVGDHIHRAWPSGSLIALNTAGSTPFLNPDKRFIDMLGLNDRTIARRHVAALRLPWQRIPGHGKGDGLYVLTRAPDYIILGPAAGTSHTAPWFLSDIELAESRDFHTCYRKRVLPLAYDAAFARRGPAWPNPLPFTYYERICGR